MTSPGGVYIAGCWSQAGLSTLIHLRILNTKASILFDCGSVISSTIHANHVFITHGHCDHIGMSPFDVVCENSPSYISSPALSGASIQHARANSLGGSARVQYHMPEACVGHMAAARSSFEALDGHDIPMGILPMKPGDSVQLSQSQFRVFAFPTEHRVPSQGYCIAPSWRFVARICGHRTVFL